MDFPEADHAICLEQNGWRFREPIFFDSARAATTGLVCAICDHDQVIDGPQDILFSARRPANGPSRSRYVGWAADPDMFASEKDPDWLTIFIDHKYDPTERNDDTEALLKSADTAMYAAKHHGRGNFQFFSAAMHDATTQRIKLEAELHQALERREFLLHYQPKLDLVTGKTSGFEALLRWNHPAFGFVPPPEIVAVAHRTGLIHELTSTVLRRALEARSEWTAAGHCLDVSVNVTPADVAELVRVDVYTVRRWIAAGHLPAYKVGRRLLVDPAKLDLFLQHQLVR